MKQLMANVWLTGRIQPPSQTEYRFPSLLEFFPGSLIIMPHAKDEIGTYKVRVTVKNNNPAYPNLAFTDVLTIIVEESLMIQF